MHDAHDYVGLLFDSDAVLGVVEPLVVRILLSCWLSAFLILIWLFEFLNWVGTSSRVTTPLSRQ